MNELEDAENRIGLAVRRLDGARAKIDWANPSDVTRSTTIAQLTMELQALDARISDIRMRATLNPEDSGIAVGTAKIIEELAGLETETASVAGD